MDDFELLKNGGVVYTDGEHRVNGDSLLLCDFARVKPAARLLDIGCGCGILGLFFADAGHQGEIVGVDDDPAALALFRRSAAAYANITIVEADANDYSESAKFDVVVCNPPYFSTGKPSAVLARAYARHDLGLSIGGTCRAAARNLKQGGSLFVCYPAVGFADLVCGLRAARLEPKRVCFVRHVCAASAYLALTEAVFCGGRSLTVEPEHIIG